MCYSAYEYIRARVTHHSKPHNPTPPPPQKKKKTPFGYYCLGWPAKWGSRAVDWGIQRELGGYLLCMSSKYTNERLSDRTAKPEALGRMILAHSLRCATHQKRRSPELRVGRGSKAHKSVHDRRHQVYSVFGPNGADASRCGQLAGGVQKLVR